MSTSGPGAPTPIRLPSDGRDITEELCAHGNRAAAPAPALNGRVVSQRVAQGGPNQSAQARANTRAQSRAHAAEGGNEGEGDEEEEEEEDGDAPLSGAGRGSARTAQGVGVDPPEAKGSISSIATWNTPVVWCRVRQRGGSIQSSSKPGQNRQNAGERSLFGELEDGKGEDPEHFGGLPHNRSRRSNS